MRPGGPPHRGYIVLTLEVFREAKAFVSRCRELETASCGDTFDEALSNIEDATIEYLSAIERLGERGRIFKEKGIAVQKTRPARIRLAEDVPAGVFVGPFVTRIPSAA